MGYSFQPISVPSSNPSLDFGPLPKSELGDIKSLTSFMDRQRKLEEDDSKKVSELSKLLFDGLKDTEHLDWAIGDDPKGRQYFNDVINYYRTRIQSLSENAGKPGVIRELSKMEAELRNDIYSPTGRLSPYVNAAKEKKRYEEHKKSPDYEKSLSTDPYYDLNNRKAFENWKGALRWDDEGKPYYASLRLQETAPAINIQKIIEDTQKAVEESDLIPALAYTENGMLVEQEASRGRNRAHIINVLRMNPQFQELRERAVKGLGDNPSKEELEKLDRDLERTFVDPIVGFKQGKVSRQDDPNSLNYEEQINTARADRQEAFRKQQEASDNYYKSLAAQQRDRSYNLEREKFEFNKQKAEAGGKFSEKDVVGGLTFETTESYSVPNIYNVNGQASPSKFVSNLERYPSVYQKITTTPEFLNWVKKLEDEIKWSKTYVAGDARMGEKEFHTKRILQNENILRSIKNDSKLFAAKQFIIKNYSNNVPEFNKFITSESMKPVTMHLAVSSSVNLSPRVHGSNTVKDIEDLKINLKKYYNLPGEVSWSPSKDKKVNTYVESIGFTTGSDQPFAILNNGSKVYLQLKNNISKIDNSIIYEKYLNLLNRASKSSESSTEHQSITDDLKSKLYVHDIANVSDSNELKNFAVFASSGGKNLSKNTPQTYNFGGDRHITVTRLEDGSFSVKLGAGFLDKQDMEIKKQSGVDPFNFRVPNALLITEMVHMYLFPHKHQNNK